jgi:hypothetical protein
VTPFGKKHEATEKKLGFAAGNSDHLTMLNAYNVSLYIKSIKMFLTSNYWKKLIQLWVFFLYTSSIHFATSSQSNIYPVMKIQNLKPLT